MLPEVENMLGLIKGFSNVHIIRQIKLIVGLNVDVEKHHDLMVFVGWWSLTIDISEAIQG